MCDVPEFRLHANCVLLEYWGREGAFQQQPKKTPKKQKIPSKKTPKTHRKKARITYLYFQIHPENQGNYLLNVFYQISPLGLKQSQKIVTDNVIVLESHSQQGFRLKVSRQP